MGWNKKASETITAVKSKTLTEFQFVCYHLHVGAAVHLSLHSLAARTFGSPVLCIRNRHWTSSALSEC